MKQPAPLPALTLAFSAERASLTSLTVGGTELLAGETPIFSLCLRDAAGTPHVFDASCARTRTATDHGAVFSDFKTDDPALDAPALDEPSLWDLTVEVTLTDGALPDRPASEWRISVSGQPGYVTEWVEFPRVLLRPLLAGGGPGRVLFPYNEGALLEETGLWGLPDAEYPSQGFYSVFPNMVFAPFLAYLTEEGGLYFGAHDPARGVKQIDFQGQNARAEGPAGNTPGGVLLRCRSFCGCEVGEAYAPDYPICFATTTCAWENAADAYRGWFSAHLPEGLVPAAGNPALPAWYNDSPLIVTYPVRGIHDMDEMTPNALFPYPNALPLVDRLAQRVGGRLLVLLMHWEGSAPWAPPYVWPPFGGEEPFFAFRDALHARGHLLGVYCSGFGYTVQSNLTPYSGLERFLAGRFADGMCAGPDGQIGISRICTGQRAGYDICPASEKGREILDEAYRPLFEAGLDYAQILDQNHGGGQYFCYSRRHGHPPVPGAWMTARMKDLLGDWNRVAGKMLLGCESSAAEPFMPHLLFSDNRYELNFHFGQAVPLYAYLYHEYLRNFMGNQVSCPFAHNEYTLAFRLAYSFVAGDALTLVLTPDGRLMTSWGDHDFTDLPDLDTTLDFVATLRRFYDEEARPYLSNAKMLPAEPISCAHVVFHHRDTGREIQVPAVLTTAWEKAGIAGGRVQILVNHTSDEQIVRLRDNAFTLPPYSAKLIPLD